MKKNAKYMEVYSDVKRKLKTVLTQSVKNYQLVPNWQNNIIRVN